MPSVATHEALATELNVIAEYAGVRVTFEVTAGPEAGTSVVTTSRSETFLVDTVWALGNVRNLPDHTDVYEILHAVRVSHPQVKASARSAESRGMGS